VLGAAVAPTDATAVGVLARALPRRAVTVLRAESLVNDGTPLVIYALAVGITVGEDRFSAVHVGWLFLLAYAGGAVAGALTAWLAVQVPGGQRGGRVPGRGVARRGACGTTDGRLGRAVPRPQRDRLRDRRGHRGDAGAGTAFAERGALGTAAPRHVRRAGASPRRDARYRGGTQRDAAGRCRPRYRPRGGRPAAPRVREHLRVPRAGEDGADDEPALRYDQQYTALRLAVLAHKRATVVRLRDERRIDDTVLWQVQARLDIEEVRLSRRELTD
jgi:hypothetical protein